MTEKPVIDQYATLLFRIQASCGATMFRSLFATVGGERVNLLRDGQVSCAVYVSGLLVWTEYVPHLCATVASLERMLNEAGWQTIDVPVPGAVVIWEATRQAGGELHEHAGFALSATEAISHVDESRTPARHHLTFGVTEGGVPTRRIKHFFIHPQLHRSSRNL